MRKKANENIGDMPVEMVISLPLLLIVTTPAVVIYKKQTYQEYTSNIGH